MSLRDCEKIDLNKLSINQMADLNERCFHASVCSFSD